MTNDINYNQYACMYTSVSSACDVALGVSLMMHLL